MIETIALVVALSLTPGYCVEDGSQGFETVDGCVTQAEYDVLYADPLSGFDIIEFFTGTPSVAKVNTKVPASERPREFEGEQLPTVSELLSFMKFGHLL